LAVECYDARRLLAAMLQGMQSKSGDGGGVGMAENPENPAFLAQTVGVEVKVEGTGIMIPRKRPSAESKALSNVHRRLLKAQA
jgi:hypothetical protein